MNAEDPVMPKARTELVLAKCQAYGRCAAVAPEAFALDTTGHVSLVSGAGTAPLDKVLRGARRLPLSGDHRF